MVVEKRMERVDKDRKKIKSPELDHEFELLRTLQGHARSQPAAAHLSLDADDEKTHRGFQFLSQKPMLYVLNLGEERCPPAARGEQEYRTGRWPDAPAPA